MPRYRSLFLLFAIAACSPDSDTKTAAVPAPSSAVATSSVPVATVDAKTSGCPHNGKWALCNVETRLRQSGFVVKKAPGKPVMRAGFSVMPAVYTLGRAHLEVFIYADSTAMARDLAKIDTLTVVPPGTPSPWDGTPVLVRSANLAAVFIADDGRQIERLTLALTAGPPQPGSPR